MLASLVDKAVTLVLLGYFLSRVGWAVSRLAESKIGTTIDVVEVEAINYPSITLCRDLKERRALFKESEANKGQAMRSPLFESATQITAIPEPPILGSQISYVRYKLLTDKKRLVRDEVTANLSVGDSRVVTHYMFRVEKEPYSNDSIGVILPCTTYNPPGKTVPGLDKGVQFDIPLRNDTRAIFLYLHTKDEIIFGSDRGSYGSAFKALELPYTPTKANGYIYSVAIVVSKTEWKRLNLEQKRCVEAKERKKGKKIDFSTCLTQFIEDKVGCGTGLLKTDSTRPPCNTTSQINDLLELQGRVQKGREQDIFVLSGCAPSCNQDTFEVKAMDKNLDTSQAHEFKFGELTVAIESGVHEEKEQFVIYTTNDFIADIGGYLGLLLGHSVLSVYISAAAWVKTKKAA